MPDVLVESKVMQYKPADLEISREISSRTASLVEQPLTIQ